MKIYMSLIVFLCFISSAWGHEHNGFEWEPDVTMLLLRKKFSYGEYPIHYFPRDFEHGKKIGWKDGIKGIYTLYKWKIKNIKHV